MPYIDFARERLAILRTADNQTVTVSELIRSELRAVDITPPEFNPLDLIGLSERFNTSLTRMLDLRRQLFELEIQLFERDAALTSEKEAIRKTLIALDADDQESLAHAANELLRVQTAAATSRRDAIRRAGRNAEPGDLEEAEGRVIELESARAPERKARAHARELLNIRSEFIEQMRSAMSDPASALAYSNRRRRLENQFRLEIKDVLKLSALLRVGIQKLFGDDANPSYPDLQNADEFIDLLLLWARNAHRLIEKEFSQDRYVTEFILKVSPGVLGPIQGMAKADFDARLTAGRIDFLVSDEHLPAPDLLREPLLRGIGIGYIPIWANSNNNPYTAQQHRLQTSYCAQVVLPNPGEIRANNPLNGIPFSFELRNSIWFGNVKIIGQEAEIFRGAWLQNTKPTGSWSIVLPPQFNPSLSVDHSEVPVRQQNFIRGLFLFLELSVKRS